MKLRGWLLLLSGALMAFCLLVCFLNMTKLPHTVFVTLAVSTVCHIKKTFEFLPLASLSPWHEQKYAPVHLKPTVKNASGRNTCDGLHPPVVLSRFISFSGEKGHPLQRSMGMCTHSLSKGMPHHSTESEGRLTWVDNLSISLIKLPILSETHIWFPQPSFKRLVKM